MGVIERLGRLGGALGEATLGFMVLSIAYDVLMRYVLLSPTIWALEVNTFLLMFLCLVPAADTLNAGTQIRITFLTDRLSPRIRGRLACATDIVAAACCAVLTWKGLTMALAAYQHNDRMSTSLGTPLAIPYLFIPLGFGLLALTYAGKAVSAVGGRDAGPAASAAGDAGQQI